MAAIYRHTQTATWIRLGVGGAAAVVAVFALYAPNPLPLLAVAAILAAVAVLFNSLTVTIDTSTLTWHFGPSISKKRLALADITAVEAVKNPWWYGWGVHLTPHGWLYNISGSEAVEITLASGRTLRIGTDEPVRLAQILEQVIGRR
jgi:hypothetical protein